jgi:hypothetical protein
MAADPILSKRKTSSVDTNELGSNEKPTRHINPYTKQVSVGRGGKPTSSPSAADKTTSNLAKINSENEGYTAEQVAKARARDAANKSTAVVANKPAPVPATPKTIPKAARRSPISSSYGTDEDITRQSAIDENAEFFRKRGVGAPGMKKGGAVKSKIDGCAVKGKTRGKYC